MIHCSCDLETFKPRASTPTLFLLKLSATILGQNSSNSIEPFPFHVFYHVRVQCSSLLEEAATSFLETKPVYALILHFTASINMSNKFTQFINYLVINYSVIPAQANKYSYRKLHSLHFDYLFYVVYCAK